MLSRQLLSRSSRLVCPAIRPRVVAFTAPISTTRAVQAELSRDELNDQNDPDMNGGYINPPAIKRQHRDPYADWWDKQERRNFGEPVHEDNDILGMFSLYDYTHMTAARGFFLWGCFIATVLGLTYTVSMTLPDKPSFPREFEDGMEAELGGPGAVRARKSGDPL